MFEVLFSKLCRLLREDIDKSRLKASSVLGGHYGTASRFLGFLRVLLGSLFSGFSKVPGFQLLYGPARVPGPGFPILLRVTGLGFPVFLGPC